MRARGSLDRRAAVLFLALAFTAGCKVKLIADYDPVLDQGVSKLATEVDAFLTRMQQTAGTPAGTYAANAGFYIDAAAEVRTLRMRAESQPKSGKLVEALDLVAKSLEDVRGRHEAHGEKGLDAAFVGPARSGLETQFRALIEIESTLRTKGA